MRCRSKPLSETRLDEAVHWLLAFLEAGPRTVADIERHAKDAGLAWATVKRARAVAKVSTRRVGFGADSACW